LLRDNGPSVGAATGAYNGFIALSNAA
jgi:hypothetical protein